MCRKVKCTGCGLATWQGCGLHIDSALNGVAECDRCSGWKTGVCQPATADDTTGDTTGEIKKEEEEMAIPTNMTPEYLEVKRAAFNKLNTSYYYTHETRIQHMYLFFHNFNKPVSVSNSCIENRLPV